MTRYHNPFLIPDLSIMYSKVRDFVKKNQGKSGFIDTTDMDNDTIWTIIYDEQLFTGIEKMVIGVRVNNANGLEICFDNTISDLDSTTSDDWRPVMNDELVYFVPTIFNIAENIEEYV